MKQFFYKIYINIFSIKNARGSKNHTLHGIARNDHGYGIETLYYFSDEEFVDMCEAIQRLYRIDLHDQQSMFGRYEMKINDLTEYGKN